MNIAPAASPAGVSPANQRLNSAAADRAANVNTQNAAPRRPEQAQTAPNRAEQQPRDTYAPTAEARANGAQERDRARETADRNAERNANDANRQQPARARNEAAGATIDLVA